ncbi:PepSY-associated TM helix domain-containing protein [Providencia vermicola]|uniref:PepSY-associated TM helix domain-containing protein n=1 Tax=Providencia vermicola TaxID=333965 RepID=UPI001CECBD63|nr:PepSY-associated TM helix domain-containing protein [Providencia vermicola]
MILRQSPSLAHRLDILHRSAGVFFGIFLFIILFSGCWSLGSDALRLWWNDAPLSGQILPINQLIALQVDAQMIQLPQENNPVITFCQGMGQCASSYSAITGKLIEQNTPAMWLVTLHKNLFLGFPGRIFLSLFGFALAVLLITGWFIQRKRIATMLRLPRRTSLRLFFHDLHSWLGLWCYPWLILFALTGALSGLGALGTVSLAQRAAPESPQMIMKNLMGGFDTVETPTDVSENTVASVITALGETVPSFIPQTVGFQGEKWIIGGVREGQLSTANFEQYQFDSTKKQLVGIRDSSQQSGWTRAFIAVQPVHYGQYQWWPQGENLASIVHFLAGIGALVLVSAGLAMWCWRRMETVFARFIVGGCGGLLLASSVLLALAPWPLLLSSYSFFLCWAACLLLCLLYKNVRASLAIICLLSASLLFAAFIASSVSHLAPFSRIDLTVLCSAVGLLIGFFACQTLSCTAKRARS